MAQQSVARKLEKEKHPESENKSRRKLQIVLPWIGGIAFTFFIALLGVGLSQLWGFDRVGPLASAIIIAIVCRQIWEYPEQIRPGIEFSAKKLLRFAIILYGLKLNINVIFNQGMPLLIRGIGTIVFVLVVMMLIAKWLKADFALSLLLAVGTAVCGAAAIAAVSPIVKSKEEDTAIGVGIIALGGTVFALLYTVIRPVLPISDSAYGIWAGVSLHEIAHVALAAAPGGEDALAIALLAKLGRVLLLIPLCFILVYWMNKRDVAKTGKTKVGFPWFLLGFIFMSLLGSYVFGEYIDVPTSVMEGVSSLSTFILTMAMVGLGLNVSFQAIRTKASRPLIAMLIVSVLLTGLSYFTL
ncbi:YeiH family protein [Thalassobacillus pellis]|uniref:YeiH family protein n=1 Tax=Thalassobacillus pellis TaxID=748008 RepID=UPI001960D077|nr:putative sulfate exporter family transporter [Thalassobacillus pellis]MBM7554471.1 putative integral membrane protein (TIGR00698 family) [Thalassobacillus pellis]